MIRLLRLLFGRCNHEWAKSPYVLIKDGASEHQATGWARFNQCRKCGAFEGVLF